MDPATEALIAQLIQTFGPFLAQLIAAAIENALKSPEHTQAIIHAILIPPQD